jgi:acyl-CoA reductase-like NAD-dependent aldehyde dehydrogenase
VEAATAPQLQSFDPATGQPLGAVPVTAAGDVAGAVEHAAGVQRLWSTLRLKDRGRYMARAAQAVIDEFDELVDLIAAEQGRPRAEAEVMELLAAVETLQWLAEHGPAILGGERIRFSRTQHPVKRGRWTYEPLGVVGVLGPATEPFATPLGDAAVALMAGNGVVLKPSPHVPLCAERIARVFARAGLPEGLLQVIHGHTDAGAALVAAPVDQVRFTGSARAGREVGEACARGLKRSVLELDGKDAMLVLADANVPRTVRGAAWAAFANAGQCGGSVERALCVRAVHDEFLAGVVAAASALRVGDPRDPATAVGPLVSRDRVERVRELVDEALAAGARLHCGGARDAAHWAPTVLTGVTPGMRVAREEVPGPVLVVEAVDSEEEAIAHANRAVLGLGASVWTADRYKGARIARELRVGMVWMNDHLVARSAPQVPWGGVGGAGIGRARGAIALRTSAEPRVVTWDPPVGRPAWWFPYDAALVKAARAVAGLRSARDVDRERAWRRDGLALLRVTGRWLRSMRHRKRFIA